MMHKIFSVVFSVVFPVVFSVVFPVVFSDNSPLKGTATSLFSGLSAAVPCVLSVVQILQQAVAVSNLEFLYQLGKVLNFQFLHHGAVFFTSSRR